MADQYNFHGTRSMLGIVNDPSKVAQADTADVWVSDSSKDLELTHYEDAVAVHDAESYDIFGIASSDYSVINPPEFFGPLAGELTDRGRSVEGHISMFEDGARGYAEVLLSDSGIWPADRDEHQEPVRSGVTVRWSHDGGISVRASAFAQDGMCENTMRNVTDPIYVKHAGDVDERVDFEEEWADLLDQLGAFSDALMSVVEEAYEYEVLSLDADLDSDIIQASDALEQLSEVQVPVFLTERDRDSINAVYELAGFPRYLAMAATSRLLWRLTQKEQDNTSVTAWDLYSGATYAITHEARFDAGSSTDDKYHRLASDMLSNPPKVMDDVRREAQNRLAPDDEQDTLTIEEDAGDAMRSYREKEEAMREALAE